LESLKDTNDMKNILITLAFTLLFTTAFAAEGILSHEVFFDTDKYELTSEQYNKLTAFVKELKNIDIDRITIHGFCDDRGSKDYNLKLSDKRAQAIKKLITDFKIGQTLIAKSIGKGEVDLTTEEQALFNQLRTQNRKVIIVVAPKKLIADSFYGEDLKTGDVIALKTLNFKMGYRFLNPESVKPLKELAAFMVKRKDIYFTIRGHVCCTENGKEAMNRETRKRDLSSARAKYIYNYLVKQGVDKSRIKFQGLKGMYNLGKEAKDDRRVDFLVRYIAKK